MSYLNALASGGLSVGLRLYADKMNNRAAASQATAPSSCCPANKAAAEMDMVTPSTSVEKSSKTAHVISQIPQTPEEMAANRVEAQAKLGAGASLGQLQATEAEKQAQQVGTPKPLANTAAAPLGTTPVGLVDLTPQEQKEVDELKEEEARILKETPSSAGGTPEYTYATGPDGEKYVTGYKDQSQKSPGDSPEEAASSTELTEEEEVQVDNMKERDREVRQHEQAHVTASGGLAGTPVYEYQTGPDGRRYANGGHVDIQTSGSSDPKVALREAELVKRAATAPAEPSGQDMAVAARASADIQRLKAETNALDSEETSPATAQENRQNANDPAVIGPNAQGSGLPQGPNQAPDGQGGSFNGSSFSQQVLGAYGAMKSALASQTTRPVLAMA